MQVDASKIKFNPNVAREAASTKRYRDGYVRAIIKSAQIARSKKKPGELSPEWYMLVLDLLPLANPEDADSGVGRGQRHYCCLPFEPTEWESRFGDDPEVIEGLRGKLAMFNRMGVQLFAALFPNDVPALPSKGADGRWYFKGEPLSEEEGSYDTAKLEACEATFAAMQQVLESGAEGLKGVAIYGKIVTNEGETNPSWDSFHFSAGYPVVEGQLVTLNSGTKIIVTVEPPAAPTPAKSNGKSNGKATTAPTKSTKKGKKS